MSYFVCHGQKAKAGDIKNIERHIERKNQNYKNKDIDKSRTHMNYDLHSEVYSSYKKRINERVKESYVGTRAIRKDATMMVNFVISSDNDFFKNLSEVQQQEYFKISYEYLRDYFGAENVLSAKVHLDETTPHMHFSAIPLVDGKLNAKNLMNRNFLRKIQSELPKILQYHGFDIERGIEGSKRGHKDTEQYKKEMQSDISSIEIEVENLIKTRKDLKSDLERFRGDLDKVNGISHIYARKTLLGANMVISEDDYNKLVDVTKSLLINNQELGEDLLDLKNKLSYKNEIINEFDNTIRDIKNNLNKKFSDKENMLLSKIQSLEEKIELGYETAKLQAKEELKKEFESRINQLNESLETTERDRNIYKDRYIYYSKENNDLEKENESLKKQIADESNVIRHMSNEFKNEYLRKRRELRERRNRDYEISR